MTEFQQHTFPNGIRLVHREVPSTRVAHLGFVLDIGSRDEALDQEGIAHFWEHMAFKGTSKRKAFHIINRLDSVGGELNAYTTKEKIYFYASILDTHYERTVELLSDITFQSTFPEREIERERRVINEEMLMYEDAPEDEIFEDFDTLIYGDHELAHPILGTQKNVAGFGREDFLRFVRENLDTSKVIISSVSNMPFKKVLRLVEKYVKDIPASSATSTRKLFLDYEPRSLKKVKKVSQAHCMVGGQGFSVVDDKRLPFFMLTNLLGGPAMTSRLNMSLRERRGNVYNVEANLTSYSDSGLFNIYFGCEEKLWQKNLALVHKELKKLREEPLGRMQLHTLKEQLMGQLAMSEESNSGLMQVMAKSLLDLGRIETLQEIFEQIRAVSSTELQDLAQEVFDENKLSYLTYLPES